MHGRDVFMESLLAHGVRHLFGNPGTTESPLIDSLARYPALSYVLALHEGIAIGAASYYAQASGRTGVVNLHVAPGLGNAIGMMYGALRANSPMVVTAGQQDTRLRLRDPLLGHDLVAMAAPVAKWSVQAESADEIAPIVRRAFKTAHDPPSGPVFVSLPIDAMEQETDIAAVGSGALYRAPAPDPDGVRVVVRQFLDAAKPAIVIGDDVARAGAGDAAVRLAEATGAGIWTELLHQHQPVPNAHPNYRGRLPSDAASIAESLGDADLVLLAGGPFFEEVWYAPTGPFPPGATVVQIEEAAERLGRNYGPATGLIAGLGPALEAVCAQVLSDRPAAFAAAADRRNESFAALREKERKSRRALLEIGRERRPMPVALALETLAAAAPEETAVVEEAITAGREIPRAFDFRGPGDFFTGRGGGIGQGVAGALGVKLACPDRPVLCISGDGSAMYSIQALWTAAHHGLPILFVILANREYRILKHNLDIYRHRFGAASNRPYREMDLIDPPLGFVEMAAGMGVAGTRVTEPEELESAARGAFSSGAPHLIEVAVEGKT
ncbi:MAG: thiamine pyrophosphate-binding protein [Defluviicoccus sp.]|nr:thiamine pyrophosphate-binding protein [Defluviicoccus sp.]